MLTLHRCRRTDRHTHRGQPLINSIVAMKCYFSVNRWCLSSFIKCCAAVCIYTTHQLFVLVHCSTFNYSLYCGFIQNSIRVLYIRKVCRMQSKRSCSGWRLSFCNNFPWAIITSLSVTVFLDVNSTTCIYSSIKKMLKSFCLSTFEVNMYMQVAEMIYMRYKGCVIM